jgi:glycosyltransferase
VKVSLITISFNSEATIGDTLRSVAEQSHPDIEHIVIDGASRDGTLQVLREHGAHVARVVSEPDNGLYDAMNKGLTLASGDVVGLLNADDMLADRHVVARIAEAFAPPLHAAPDCVYGDLVYVAADDLERVVRYWRSGVFAPSRLKFGWMPPHPAFYMRRSLLDDVGRFDTTLRIAADYDFMLRCLTRPGVRVAYVPEVLVRMRLGGISNRSMASLRDKSREDLAVMRRHGVGGWFTLASKNMRKLPQFLASAPRKTDSG